MTVNSPTLYTSMRILSGILLMQVLAVTTTYAQEVVVTIKPLHSLVQGVLGDQAKAKLLIDGNASPHGYALKPSQMSDLSKADILFYIDPAFESFLPKTIKALPASVKCISLSKQKGVVVLNRRSKGEWEEEHHEDDHDHDHHHGSLDMHIWLSPYNAKKMVYAISSILSAAYPEHKDVFGENAMGVIARLNKLDAKLKIDLAKAKKPYAVFHDAYQYFEKTYELNAVGAISLDPENSTSLKQVMTIRNKLKSSGAKVIFKEPQFPDKLIKTVIGDMKIGIGMLDPLGVDIPTGKEAYFTIMTNMANTCKKALSEDSK